MVSLFVTDLLEASVVDHQQTEPEQQGTDEIDAEAVIVKENTIEIVEEIEDDVFSEEPLRKQLSFGRSVVKWDRDCGASDASCYFSASASHSDTNYCSTDEHEHIFHGAVMAQHGLHSSDSGADISEKNFGRKDERNEGFFEGVKDALVDETKVTSMVHAERNNSLPEVFGREDLQEAWESYWNQHGESIIWASWIEKYSDYINPEYLDQVPQQAQHETNCTSPHSKSEATPDTTYDASKHFSFDTMEADPDPKAPTEIIVTTSSPHPCSRSDDFNDIWITHRSGSGENEALLSPRCDSVTSSIPLTIGTTDSMTNVTRMTISSYDFCSSKVSSESSNLSESSLSEPMSSESESSNSSDLLETACLRAGGVQLSSSLDGAEPSSSTLQEDEAAMDGEQYWQILWQKHFQEMYATHYNTFMAEKSGEHVGRESRNKMHKRKRNSSSGSGMMLK